jgi:hypothetical protein
MPATAARRARAKKSATGGDVVALLERDVAGLEARRSHLLRQLGEHVELMRQLRDALDVRNELLRGYIKIHDALADLHGEGECRCALCLAAKPALRELLILGPVETAPPQEPPGPPA